jgi:hypothetical protein
MKLKDFPFNTTYSLPTFSDLLTNAINNCLLPIKQKTEFDEIECWYYTWSDACIGRYLSYRIAKNQLLIEFWLGIEIKADEVRLILWFEQKTNKTHWTQLKTAIKNIFFESENSEDEIWIPLSEDDFDKFCSKNYQVVSDFLNDVFSKLELKMGVTQ